MRSSLEAMESNERKLTSLHPSCEPGLSQAMATICTDGLHNPAGRRVAWSGWAMQLQEYAGACRAAVAMENHERFFVVYFSSSGFVGHWGGVVCLPACLPAIRPNPPYLFDDVQGKQGRWPCGPYQTLNLFLSAIISGHDVFFSFIILLFYPLFLLWSMLPRCVTDRPNHPGGCEVREEKGRLVFCLLKFLVFYLIGFSCSDISGFGDE